MDGESSASRMYDAKMNSRKSRGRLRKTWYDQANLILSWSCEESELLKCTVIMKVNIASSVC